MVRFDWDRAKAASNLRKHKVDFELAAPVILDRCSESVLDEDQGAFEERWVTMGVDQEGQLLVICHTITEEDENDELVRIISARRATPRERRQYKSGT